MQISEKILNLRKSKNYSQDELASQLNVSRQAISRWESGTSLPETENILQLCKIFNVSSDYLLNDSIQELKTQRNFSSMRIITTLIVLFGFIVMLIGYAVEKRNSIILSGFLIQLIGICIFEYKLYHDQPLHFSKERKQFYIINCCFLALLPFIFIFSFIEFILPIPILSIYITLFKIVFYIILITCIVLILKKFQ